MVNGTPLSAAIREAILQHGDLAFQDAVEEVLEDLHLSRSIIERVAHTHSHEAEQREIVRGVRPLKPPNSEEDQEIRVEFCEWALAKLDQGAIFIFSDEAWIEVGGKPRKRPKISRPKGVNAIEYAESTPPVQFALMQWGACCLGHNDDAPIWLWEKETKEEKIYHKMQLELENNEAKVAVGKQRAKALISGTQEHRVLQETNANIQQHNQALREQGHTGNKGTKRQRKPEQLWKHAELKRMNERGGIDWFLYREYCLMPFLYPYYEQVQRAHSDKEIWLVEDNAALHTKAAEICEKDRRERGILKAPWPPNSPDLNSIENA